MVWNGRRRWEPKEAKVVADMIHEAKHSQGISLRAACKQIANQLGLERTPEALSTLYWRFYQRTPEHETAKGKAIQQALNHGSSVERLERILKDLSAVAQEVIAENVKLRGDVQTLTSANEELNRLFDTIRNVNVNRFRYRINREGAVERYEEGEHANRVASKEGDVKL
jgi:hypothetical protein